MSWEQLRSIRDEQIQAVKDDQRPPIACPNDGEPLKAGPHGELYCGFDDWEYQA